MPTPRAADAEDGADGPVFVGPLGGRLRRHNFRRLWLRALDDVGLGSNGVHFHDLRHTGNHLAAVTGASTKELMARMGHSSARAALIYQYATRERDREIAQAISQNVGQRERAQKADPPAEGHAGHGHTPRPGRACRLISLHCADQRV